ncbi:MAG: precorrin-6y C5,15-methyltransferase (decarboxylating) subunit CbiE [Desulfobacterota bacterium]|nr:precorrin-6y C5,15-methyltransferase (decarboxylating) subunit CbiE [Thermodesulfobacteriota bacterium]
MQVAQDKRQGKIFVIGIGVSKEGLSSCGHKIIGSADVLFGGRRLLAMFPESAAQKIEIKSNINELINKLKTISNKKRAVVLASGDPNFFGIAAVLYRAFPKNRLEIIPNITAFQAAFARIKESWDNAQFFSVHGRPLACLDAILRTCGMFVVYCDNVNTPAKVLRYMVGKAPWLRHEQVWICDRLGEKEERIIAGNVGTLTDIQTSDLSLMIIKQTQNAPTLSFGIPDNIIPHERTMITKRDIRLLVLARLNLAHAAVLWDIGAGSGAVSVEAANLYPRLSVFAVERDKKRYENIVKTIQKYRLVSLTSVFGEAPSSLKELPAPDAVFIGGSGGRLSGIMAVVKQRLAPKGSLVINCVTLETLAEALEHLRRWGWQYEVVSVQHAYLCSDDRPALFRPATPVYIVHSVRKAIRRIKIKREARCVNK